MNAQDTSCRVSPCCSNADPAVSEATKQCAPDKCFQLLLMAFMQRQGADTQMSHEEADLQVGG